MEGFVKPLRMHRWNLVILLASMFVCEGVAIVVGGGGQVAGYGAYGEEVGGGGGCLGE